MILRDIDGTFFDETKILGAKIYTNNYGGDNNVGIEIYVYKNNYRFKYANAKLVREDLFDIQKAFELRNKPVNVETINVKNYKNPFSEYSTIF